jgi:hypothetical protein
MNIVNHDGRWGTFSWSGGVRFRVEPALLEEARRNFDAVINRLLLEGRLDEAEEIFWRLAETMH